MSSSMSKRPASGGSRPIRAPSPVDSGTSSQSSQPSLHRNPSLKNLHVGSSSSQASTTSTVSPSMASVPSQAIPSGRPASASRRQPVLHSKQSHSTTDPQARQPQRSNSSTRNSASSAVSSSISPATRPPPLSGRRSDDTGRQRKGSGQAGVTQGFPMPASVSDAAVKVFLRVRPFSEREKEKLKAVDGDAPSPCFTPLDNQSVLMHEVANNKPRRFNFDGIIYSPSEQKNVFDSIARPICDSCIAGYNGTIFAYGQTGSGKTFTIQGAGVNANATSTSTSTSTSISSSSSQIGTLTDLDGIMPRSFEYLFHQLDDLKRRVELDGGSAQFGVKCTYVEIYNEVIYDLLDNTPDKTVSLVFNNDSFVMSNACSVPVAEPADCRVLMHSGVRNRHTSSTLMNCESSRSHSVFTIHLSVDMTNSIGERITRHSRLNIIDLAGSERLSNTGVSGDGLKEAQSINKSLSMLSNVISRINEDAEGGRTGRGHIPYRNSTLTKLLQDSLGGNSMTYIVACISPATPYAGETLSTLRFTESARKIDNKPKLNEQRTQSVTIAHLSSENKKLKRILKLFQSKMGEGESIDATLQEMGMDEGKFTALLNDNSEDTAELESQIIELQDQLKHSESLRTTLEVAHEELNDRYSISESRLRSTESKLVSMQARLLSTEEQLADTEQQLAASREECENTRLELVSTQNTLVDTQHTLTTTQNTLSQTQDELSTTQATLASTQEELSTTQGLLSDALAREAALEATLSVRTQELADARQEISRLTDVIATRDAEIARLEEVERSLNSTIDDLQRKIEKLSEKLINAVHKAKEYLELAEERKKHIGELNSEISSLNSTIVDLNGKIAGLETDKCNLRLDLKDAQSRFESERQEKEGIIAADTCLIAEKQNEIFELSNKLKAEQSALWELNNRYSVLSAESVRKESEYIGQINTMQTTHDETVSSLETQLCDVNTELETTSIRLSETEEKVVELDEVIRRQDDQIIRLSGHHNPNQRINVLQQLKIENDDLKRENMKLKNQLSSVSRELTIVTRPNIMPSGGVGKDGCAVIAGAGAGGDENADEEASGGMVTQKMQRIVSAKSQTKPLWHAKSVNRK